MSPGLAGIDLLKQALGIDSPVIFRNMDRAQLFEEARNDAGEDGEVFGIISRVSGGAGVSGMKLADEQ